MPIDTVTTSALAASAVALLSAFAFLRPGARPKSKSRGKRQDAQDTVAAWPPEATKVLTRTEIDAYSLLTRAAPGLMVLAQVPLSRFVRVPTRNSYADWLSRVGNLNADLLLCDGDSRVLAVVEVRAPQESPRSQRRHERMLRVLQSADVSVHVWRQGSLPTVSEARAQLAGLLVRHGTAATLAEPLPVNPILNIPLRNHINAHLGPEMPRPPEFDLGIRLIDGRVALPEPVTSNYFDDLDQPDLPPPAEPAPEPRAWAEPSVNLARPQHLRPG